MGYLFYFKQLRVETLIQGLERLKVSRKVTLPWQLCFVNY